MTIRYYNIFKYSNLWFFFWKLYIEKKIFFFYEKLTNTFLIENKKMGNRCFAPWAIICSGGFLERLLFSSNISIGDVLYIIRSIFSYWKKSKKIDLIRFSKILIELNKLIWSDFLICLISDNLIKKTENKSSFETEDELLLQNLI